MAKKDRPWEPEWIKGDEIGSGGQGRAYLARRADDGQTEWKYVLKVLKFQENRERRARLSIEAGVLNLIKHPNVAQLVDSNTNQYETDVDLYLVTQHIVGDSLERFRDKILDFGDAVQVIIGILSTLDYCHNTINVIHRDIKPCHVILRGDNVNDPVLIDFGIAFAQDLGPTDFSTETSQAIGNRFIVLPEQSGESAAKRDPVSDITQVVGLFFFLLFHKNPGLIVDQTRRKPHERFDWRRTLSGLENWQLDQIGRILGVGFALDPIERWQSAKRLTAEMEVLLEDLAPKTRTRTHIERLAGLQRLVSQSTEAKLLLRLEEVGEKVQKLSDEFVVQINQSLKQHITVGKAGSGFIQAKKRWEFTYLPTARLRDRICVRLGFAIELYENELVLTLRIGRTDRKKTELPLTELVAVPVFDDQAVEILSQAVDDTIERTVADVIR